MEKCFRCDKTEDEVKLVDAIYENEISKICEKCALVENIPILRKPSTQQLEAAEQPFSVYRRFKQKPVNKEIEKIAAGNLKKPIETKTFQSKPLNLVDNFNWHITRARRAKGFSIKQLSEAIAESEEVIKMAENGNLPDNANKLIGKIEQFLKINLRKQREENQERSQEERKEPIKTPARILNFDPETVKNLTLSDLIKMKKEKESEDLKISPEEIQNLSKEEKQEKEDL